MLRIACCLTYCCYRDLDDEVLRYLSTHYLVQNPPGQWCLQLSGCSVNVNPSMPSPSAFHKRNTTRRSEVHLSQNQTSQPVTIGEKGKMASFADDQLGEATESEATAAREETRSNQGGDAPDTTRNQQATQDANEAHQPVCRLFTLPPEIRTMIFGFVCTESPEINVPPQTPVVTLPGRLPRGMASLMSVINNAHLRSEVVHAVWKNCSIVWTGSLTSKTWQKFKKTAFPGIRHLTIKFQLSDQTWFDLDSDIRRTLTWIWQNIKRADRAGTPWSMKQLKVCGVRYNTSPRLSDGDSKWYFLNRAPKPGCMHWSQDFMLKRIRPYGITVVVDVEGYNPWGWW